MWKNNKQAKKRQKTAKQAEEQLGGKAITKTVTKAAAAIQDKEGDIWNKETLDVLFNKTIQYLVVNSYVFTVTELYIWQLKGKALLPL